jgi:hypothetical protein
LEPIEPVGVLRVAAAKREDGVRETRALGPSRSHPYYKGTITPLFDRQPIIGDAGGIVLAWHEI